MRSARQIRGRTMYSCRLRWVGVMACVLALAAPVMSSAAAPATDVSALLQRAGQALDLKEIERLQRSYGYYIDHSDWDNVVDLLTDDATASTASRACTSA